MIKIERQFIQKDHSFFTIQALVLFYGLSQLADILVSIPKEKVLQEYSHIGRAIHPSRLPTIQSNSKITTIRVKKGEGIRLKIDNKDYLVHDYRPRKHKTTGKQTKGYGVVRHGGELRLEGKRYWINHGISKTIRENTTATVDGINITHFNS